MRLKFTFWLKRPSLTSEVKGHFEKKVSNLIYEVDRKSFIKISRTVLYLYAFKIYILASEVKIGLGGQRS